MANLRSKGGIWWHVDASGKETVPFQSEDRVAQGYNVAYDIAIQEFNAKNGIIPPAPVVAEPLPPRTGKVHNKLK